MTSNDNPVTDTDILRANINNETSQINWQELQRFFAGGWLIYVSSNTNLLDVAVAFSLDDKEKVSKWLTSGEVAKVSDEQAKQWHQQNTTFWPEDKQQRMGGLGGKRRLRLGDLPLRRHEHNPDHQ